MTPVIFRKYKDGNKEVLAVLPTLPGTNDSSTCACYQHIGQHSSMQVSFLRDTLPASPSEYADLLAELKSIGYDDLEVYERYQAQWGTIRSNAIRGHWQHGKRIG